MTRCGVRGRSTNACRGPSPDPIPEKEHNRILVHAVFIEHVEHETHFSLSENYSLLETVLLEQLSNDRLSPDSLRLF
jgi:hypothetical protein